MIPPHQANGELPPGIHDTTWAEITTRYAYNPQRRKLLRGLLKAARILKHCSSHWILINGSFVTNKPHPNDIDTCYDDTHLDYALLENTEPVFLDFKNARAKQKQRFNSEFFPAQHTADPAGQSFIQFFQHNREGQPKGILKLMLHSLPSPKKRTT